MWKFSLLVFLCLGIANAFEYVNEDPYLDIPFKIVKTSEDRIKEQGYPAESHFVETEDNYVLNVFRIPYSPKDTNTKDRPVVLIQHGLFSCSDCYLLNGAENAIAYNFADRGFDVWLGNARGNLYSRNNTRLSVKHPYFWRYSWHEIGMYDIPAMIDYILDKTGQESLHYVGHSQGTTVFFVMASTRPEYNAKIKTSHMLAPAIFMGNTTDDLVMLLSPLIGHPGLVADLFADQQFLPQNPIIQRFLDTACGGNPTFPEYCETLFLMWAGPENPNLNVTLLPQVAETHPAGISTNQGMHYMQSFLTNEFRYFDYGPKKNLRYHGTETPPAYNLKNIVCDMYIYYGLADTSATAADVQRLPDYLVNLKELIEIEDERFGHLDFVFALKVKEMINDRVIQFCVDYEDNVVSNSNNK